MHKSYCQYKNLNYFSVHVYFLCVYLYMMCVNDALSLYDVHKFSSIRPLHMKVLILIILKGLHRKKYFIGSSRFEWDNLFLIINHLNNFPKITLYRYFSDNHP